MAVSAVCYVLAAFHPSLVLLIPIVLVYSAGYGAYQAVDWALALKVLPAAGSAGKDMGIWHVSMVLPQIIGPASTGWLISGVKAWVSAPVAYTIAFGLAARGHTRRPRAADGPARHSPIFMIPNRRTCAGVRDVRQ